VACDVRRHTLQESRKREELPSSEISALSALSSARLAVPGPIVAVQLAFHNLNGLGGIWPSTLIEPLKANPLTLVCPS
jgi:hypothetical protein